MSEPAISDNSNVIGVRTVYDAVLRLEGKLDSSTARLESEFDAHKVYVNTEIQAVRTEQTYQRGKVDGSLGLIKWLGPSGLAALLLGVLVMAGVIKPV